MRPGWLHIERHREHNRNADYWLAQQPLRPPEEVAVKHPQGQCPRCGTVMFWFGAMSHANRCWVGWEPWRLEPRKTAEQG